MVFQKDGPFSWVYLVTTAVLSFTAIGLNDASGVVVAIFAEHFNETTAKAGWAGSVAFFLLFSASPLVIYTHRRLGFRWCMLIASFLYSMAFAITPFMSSLNFVFVTYSIPFGISMSFASFLTVTTQREYFNKYYGFSVGVRFSANASGSIVVSFILPIIFRSLGFRKTLLSLLLFTPLFLLYGLVSRSSNHNTNTQQSRKPRTTTRIFREFLQDKSFVICLVATSLYFTVALVPLIFMVQFGVMLGFPLNKAKWLVMVRSMTTLPARLLAGRVGDIWLKHGKIKLVVQITYFLFGLLCLLSSYFQSFPFLMSYMALVGVVEGVFWVTYPLYVVEITGGYHSDEALSLMCFPSGFATLIGPPVLGWVFDKTGDFRHVFYIIFVLSTIATFLLFVSSRVKVEKHLSLVEKGRKRKVDHGNRELVDGTTQSVEEKITGSLLAYETSV